MSTRIAFDQAQSLQPQSLPQVLTTVVQQWAQPGLADLIVARAAGRIDHVALVGIGASHAAAASGVQSLLERGISASRHLPGERPLTAPWPANTLVVGISQSGRSPEVVEALTAADASGALTLALTNRTDGPLSQVTRWRLGLGDQPDSYASTLGWTATLLGLDLLAAGLAGDLPRAEEAWQQTWPALTQSPADRLLDQVVQALVNGRSVDLVGTGHLQAVAEGAALLIREVDRIPAAAIETRNYLHGAMESAGTTVHLLLGEHRELSAAITLAEHGHPAVVIGSRRPGHEGFAGPLWLPRAELDGARAAVSAILPLQQIASRYAHRQGIDIEQFIFNESDTKVGPVPTL